jgi:uncharacterized paraquat-inducible protein A
MFKPNLCPCCHAPMSSSEAVCTRCLRKYQRLRADDLPVTRAPLAVSKPSTDLELACFCALAAYRD